MVDLGQLEKLNELREKGILTDEEFQIEKQKLLTPDVTAQREPRTGIVVAIAVAAIVIIGAILLFMSRDNVEQPMAVASSDTADAPLKVASAAPSPPATQEASPAGSY